MSYRTRIAIAAALGCITIATAYVYWTRTPQYALLHVLDAYEKADHGALAAYIEDAKPRNTLYVPHRDEKVLHHLARLQNEALARAYRLTVEESRVKGKIATLRVKVGETPYQLRFEEQIDGHWRIMDFEDRQAFLERTIKGMKPNHFMIIARL